MITGVDINAIRLKSCFPWAIPRTPETIMDKIPYPIRTKAPITAICTINALVIMTSFLFGLWVSLLIQLIQQQQSVAFLPEVE